MVIVTYHPEMNILTKVIESMFEQVRKIYIVDNTPGKAKELEQFRNEKVEIIYLGKNKGIAYAQNIGIKKSLEDNSDYIVLSDQDTIYPKNYIKKMLNDLNLYPEKDKVVAIAPMYFDNTKNKRNFMMRFNSFGFETKFYPDSGIHQISCAIASGLIIFSANFLKVGFMNEDLFIDFVDTEWCWRAIKKGYQIIGNANILISHKLGDKIKKIGPIKFITRSPIRYYYITRNSFYLATKSNFCLNRFHRISIFLKSIKYFFVYAFLGGSFKSFKYTLLGFWHGIIGKMGKLNEEP